MLKLHESPTRADPEEIFFRRAPSLTCDGSFPSPLVEALLVFLTFPRDGVEYGGHLVTRTVQEHEALVDTEEILGGEVVHQSSLIVASEVRQPLVCITGLPLGHQVTFVAAEALLTVAACLGGIN